MMPQTDGWEMLRKIQEQYGAGAIPVVMFSGKVDEQALAQASTSGAQAFVGKPFDMQQLIDQTKQIAAGLTERLAKALLPLAAARPRSTRSRR